MPILVSMSTRIFTQRTFHVNVNGTLSHMAEAISGVPPQGSVVSPILFVIYFNDLPDRLSADNLLYADDVKIIAPRNQHHIRQNSLNISAVANSPSQFGLSILEQTTGCNSQRILGEIFQDTPGCNWQSQFPEVPI